MLRQIGARRALRMLENESLWEAAERVHGVLAREGIDHAILGGVAVCLHGYQSKLACGLGNLRRTHKDFADVVELIAIHHLDGSFARKLHKSLRNEFRQLVRRVEGGRP